MRFTLPTNVQEKSTKSLIRMVNEIISSHLGPDNKKLSNRRKAMKKRINERTRNKILMNLKFIGSICLLGRVNERESKFG
jgi:hypothetical protein